MSKPAFSPDLVEQLGLFHCTLIGCMLLSCILVGFTPSITPVVRLLSIDNRAIHRQTRDLFRNLPLEKNSGGELHSGLRGTR